MDAFYWLKSDRSTFQIFCSRSLRQYRINYKFHVSVRLLTIKMSQWAHEDFCSYCKMIYYMALSHKVWELPNSRIWLAETDIDRGLDFPI